MELTLTHWLMIGILVIVIAGLITRIGKPGSTLVDYYEMMSKPPDEDVIDLVRAGHKLKAIKLVRSRTGLGLKEAKDYVERINADEPQ